MIYRRVTPFNETTEPFNSTSLFFVVAKYNLILHFVSIQHEIMKTLFHFGLLEIVIPLNFDQKTFSCRPLHVKVYFKGRNYFTHSPSNWNECRTRKLNPKLCLRCRLHFRERKYHNAIPCVYTPQVWRCDLWLSIVIK